MTARTTILSLLAATVLAACAWPMAKPPSSGHIGADSAPPPKSSIPQPVQQSAAVPRPKAAPKTETYSVVVKDVKVEELLFALARDAKLNVDIHPGIRGTVTLNAIDQTLPQLLNRIAKQVDMRFELDGPNLVVMPDSPYLRTYKVDYVNMSRDTTGNVAINTQIASISPTAAGAGGAGAAAGGTSGNVSSTKVDNVAKNRFWETLEKNVKDILRETDKEIIVKRRVAEGQEQAAAAAGAAAPAAGGAAAPSQIQVQIAPQPQPQSAAGKEYETLQAASVMVNPETGVMLVRATGRQHEKIQGFLDQVLSSARRQVMIEATIVEVRLNQNYQQGIDWLYLTSKTGIGQSSKTRSFSYDPVSGGITASTVESTLPSAVANTLFTAAFRRGDFLAAIKLLETFGTLKVISSPKLSVLNNQTAILKVVDNVVYFQVKSEASQGQTSTVNTVTTTPQSVSVGLVMSVTPQISEGNAVLLNVRPTISRITGYKRDPNPILPSTIPNNVPEIQTREMESLMSVNDGDIAVLGGLMQDSMNNTDDTVPGVSNIPILGNLFMYRNDTMTKSELVVFMRPTVLRDASIQSDFGSFRSSLPGRDFFDNKGQPQPVPEFNLGGAPQ
jgi:general secretion pathway protein D